MITDRPPRSRDKRAQFSASDALSQLDLPHDDRFERAAAPIVQALADGDRPLLQLSCSHFSQVVCEFYRVPIAKVKVLASRPRRVYEDSVSELYGDYEFESYTIRVWMRTAVQKKVTTLGTFLSTLCHELCHHIDVHKLGFPDTPHTRGFYVRTGQLYHAARGTVARPLSWIPIKGGGWRVDWSKLRRG